MFLVDGLSAPAAILSTVGWQAFPVSQIRNALSEDVINFVVVSAATENFAVPAVTVLL